MITVHEEIEEIENEIKKVEKQRDEWEPDPDDFEVRELFDSYVKEYYTCSTCGNISLDEVALRTAFNDWFDSFCKNREFTSLSMYSTVMDYYDNKLEKLQNYLYRLERKLEAND